MQIGCKNVRIFIDGAILYYIFSTFSDLQDLAISAVQEIDLQIETPPLHLRVKIVQVGIVHDVFKMGIPPVMLREKFG